MLKRGRVEVRNPGKTFSAESPATLACFDLRRPPRPEPWACQGGRHDQVIAGDDRNVPWGWRDVRQRRLSCDHSGDHLIDLRIERADAVAPHIWVFAAVLCIKRTKPKTWPPTRLHRESKRCRPAETPVTIGACGGGSKRKTRNGPLRRGPIGRVSSREGGQSTGLFCQRPRHSLSGFRIIRSPLDGLSAPSVRLL
ncbi:MAG: hypothetical protein JWO83_1938 [Caulobacteraceae bacterium]|nr:hypothetical protein [Caulobacteraceae bacterium]